MTLLLRTLVVAALIVLTTATSPSNHIKQPDDDKNQASYRYKYTIEDQEGDGHGKAEVREADNATGRYYVNTKRALTNVKYIADEWGYHPLVQYGSSDNHSSTATTFAIGEKAVVNQPNKNVVHRASDFLLPGDKIQLVQVLQPYQRPTKNTESADIFVIKRNDTWVPDDSVTIFVPDISLHTASTSVPINSFNFNYANNIPNRKRTEKLTPSRKKGYLVKEHQLSTEESSDFVSSLENDLPTTVSEDDQLLIDNAGNFGQRLQSKDNMVSSASSSTASPISIYSDRPLSSSTIHGEHYFRGSIRKKNDKAYLPNTIPGLGAYSSTTFPFLDNSDRGNTIDSESAQNQENNSIENLGWRTYSTLSNRVTGSSFGTTRNPFLTNYASKDLFSSFSKATSAIPDKKQEYSFSGPIVVPDLSKEIPFQYSTTFECDDESSSTPDPVLSKQNTSRDTTSSYILNPIQAGVALVNAGETHLITNNDGYNKTTPDYVRGKIQKAYQSNTIQVHEKNYLGHISYGEKNNNQTDNIVEIQKSIELTHDYPKQNSEKSTLFSEVQYIDPPPLKTQKHLQEDVYLTKNAESKSKKSDGSRTRSETLTKIYEITDIYPKDLSGEKPIYVIPPATYILEDSSILKNSLLQEKVQQHQLDLSEADSKIKSNEQQIQIITHNGVNTKPFRSLNAGTTYDTEILHDHEQIIPTKSTTKYETSSEKLYHVPYVYSVEKIIDKIVPYQYKKIVEKKIPVVQPYAIPIHVPVPKPIPIHVEKINERKIPVPVHIPIPQPYPIEKEIHIPLSIENIMEKPVHIPIGGEKKVPVAQHYPVELEKIVERKIPYPIELTQYVEKPSAVHAPYGVQYGVSYQQIMKPQNNGLYSHQSNKLAPLYALPTSSKVSFGSNINNITKSLNDVNINSLNHSQIFQGYIYDKPSISFNEGKENFEKYQFPNKVGAKIFTYNSYIPPYSLSNVILHRRYNDNQRPNKPERDDYFGPVPPLHHNQRQFGFQSKAFPTYPIAADRTQSIRKSRNYEPMRYQKGNFRQSKIEYGFKPPMVPSVQYDEETASKVER